MDMVRKGFGKRPLKDLTLEKKRVEEFEKSLMRRLWMNQSCFTLRFLSQNSLWKLSFFRGYKVYLYWGENGMWRVRFFKIGLARGLTESRDNRTASCPILSCSAPTSVTLQLLACLAREQLLAACSHESPTRSSRDSLFFLHTLEHFFTLSHSIPLQESHLNTGLLIAEIQANLVWSKANKMVDKIQPYTCSSISLYFGSHFSFFLATQ